MIYMFQKSYKILYIHPMIAITFANSSFTGNLIHFGWTHPRVAIVLIRIARLGLFPLFADDLRTDEDVSDGIVEKNQPLWHEWAQISDFFSLVVNEEVNLQRQMIRKKRRSYFPVDKRKFSFDTVT